MSLQLLPGLPDPPGQSLREPPFTEFRLHFFLDPVPEILRCNGIDPRIPQESRPVVVGPVDAELKQLTNTSFRLTSIEVDEAEPAAS